MVKTLYEAGSTGSISVGELRSRTLHGAVKENKTERLPDFLDNVGGRGTHRKATIYQVSVCAQPRKLKIFFTKSGGKKN